MSDARLDVYLLGEPQPGVDRPTLVRNLATTFKKDVPVIEKMLRKPRSLLKADVDAATAAKYQGAIKKAGGQCELINHGEELFPSEALSPVAARAPLSVAPIEPTALSPAVDDQAPAANNNSHSNAHSHSPYRAPNTHSESTDYFCYKCGRGIAPNLASCPYCHTPQVQFNHKNKGTAGLLAFFFGGFGIHRFYLGQWWGIFYLLFWGSFIPTIVSFIEAFVFWFTSNERWNAKYGHVPAASTGFKVAVGIAAFLGIISIIGILAAVSLPAYQDYTARAKVHAGLPLINQTRDKVTAVIREKDFLPSENLLAGLPDNISNEFIGSITLSEDAQMIVAFRIPHLERDNKNIIIWIPQEEGGQITWHCKGGTMPDKYRVPECRNGGSNTTDNASLRAYSSDKSISLLMPASWKSDSGLNVDADIGISNMRDSVFVVVLRESKADFDVSVTLSRYADIMANEGLDSSAKDIHIVEPTRDLTVNGLPAQQLVMTGTVDNIKITYVITTIDSGSHFQVIYAWTLASRFEMQRALLKKVSESFTVHGGASQ